ASSFAAGTITVDGSIEEGDVATIKIEDRSYSYTVKATDTLDSVRDALVAAIGDTLDANPGESVSRCPLARFIASSCAPNCPGRRAKALISTLPPAQIQPETLC